MWFCMKAVLYSNKSKLGLYDFCFRGHCLWCCCWCYLSCFRWWLCFCWLHFFVSFVMVSSHIIVSSVDVVHRDSTCLKLSEFFITPDPVKYVGSDLPYWRDKDTTEFHWLYIGNWEQLQWHIYYCTLARAAWKSPKIIDCCRALLKLTIADRAPGGA